MDATKTAAKLSKTNRAALAHIAGLAASGLTCAVAETHGNRVCGSLLNLGLIEFEGTTGSRVAPKFNFARHTLTELGREVAAAL